MTSLTKAQIKRNFRVMETTSHALPRERFSLALPPSGADRLRSIARDRDISVQDTIRLALGILDTFESVRAGGAYIGATRVRENLETVLMMPL